ncbi:hypothetical protein Mycsm_06111 [Mycobacterium sp. JS623]|nr:hypothetical protein Mycsm_06111 [Mycobacterium sp. JS623]
MTRFVSLSADSSTALILDDSGQSQGVDEALNSLGIQHVVYRKPGYIDGAPCLIRESRGHVEKFLGREQIAAFLSRMATSSE